MVIASHGPRKRRTRQHVIADLSVHHVEGFILEEGHTARKLDSEYSYDLSMRTFDEDGFAEPGLAYFQAKASESLHSVGSNFVFDVDVRDYNLWIDEPAPVILILFDAARREAFWLAIQDYFKEDMARAPRKNAKFVRVHVPQHQLVNREAVRLFREMLLKSTRPKLRIRS